MTIYHLQICHVPCPVFLGRKGVFCVNGLVVPAGSSIYRVIHAGKEGNFFNRLDKTFNSVASGVGNAGKMLENLATLECNPELLAQANRSQMIFDINCSILLQEGLTCTEIQFLFRP